MTVTIAMDKPDGYTDVLEIPLPLDPSKVVEEGGAF